MLCVVLVAGYYYWFVPGASEYMSFTAPENTSGSDSAVADADDSSSTDIISPPSFDEAPVQQKSSVKKISRAAITPEKVSVPVADDTGSDTSVDTIVPQENNSSSVITLALPTACSFPGDVSEAILSREIILNEIAWMGSVSSSNAEWMEIKNSSGHDINLSGWKLLSASGKITISFSASDIISSGGFLLLSRNSSSGISYSGDLSNTGDALAIVDPQCTVSDFLDASSGWPAGNNTTKQTLERDADGIGWHTSVSPGGTPDAENSVIVLTSPSENNSVALQTSTSDGDASPISIPTITEPTSTDDVATTTPSISNNTPTSTPVISSGHVLIAAVQIAGASSSNDFVKLYNPTQTSIDMSGWKLHKRSSTGTDYSIKTFPTGSVIASGQFFVWANSTAGFSESIGANVSSTETLSADNSVALLDANGTMIDALAWGTGTGQYGEGPPYPTDPTASQILTRQLVNGSMVDTSNNANDFTVQ